MKKKQLISKIERLIKINGSKETTAYFLNITVRYLDMILKGRQPGRKVYRSVSKLLRED